MEETVVSPSGAPGMPTDESKSRYVVSADFCGVACANTPEILHFL